jgi:GDPmannose 4,6-dehydratase
MSIALITGIAGQDGTYLAELLLAHGYQVHGMIGRPPAEVSFRRESLRDRVVLHQADLLDQRSLVELLKRVRPREVYHLAARGFVPASWNDPAAAGEYTALGVTRLLEAVRAVDPRIRLFQAGSAEVFGNPPHEPQNEETPFSPRNPYGAAKAYAHWLGVSYREKYGMFVANGILFNHESPLRGAEFVTRTISQGVARIKLGRASKLPLGNLDARRDWGFAGDFVRAMWLMLQQDRPDDYVIATGVAHAVREFVELAFRQAGLDWRAYVEVDPGRVRVEEGIVRRGDSRKARERLGWRPEVTFEQLVAMMVDADLQAMTVNGESS